MSKSTYLDSKTTHLTTVSDNSCMAIDVQRLSIPAFGAGASATASAITTMSTGSGAVGSPRRPLDITDFRTVTLADLQAMPSHVRHSFVARLRDSAFMAEQRINAFQEGSPEEVQANTQRIFGEGRFLRLLLDMEVSEAGVSKSDYELARKNLRRLEREAADFLEQLQTTPLDRRQKADFIRPFFRDYGDVPDRSNIFHDPDIRKLYTICQLMNYLSGQLTVVDNENASSPERFITHGLAHGHISLEGFQHIAMHILTKNGFTISHVTSIASHRPVVLGKYVLVWGNRDGKIQCGLKVMSSFTTIFNDAKHSSHNTGSTLLSTRLRNLMFITNYASDTLLGIWRKLDPQNPTSLHLTAEAAVLRGEYMRAFELYENIVISGATGRGFYRMDLVERMRDAITNSHPHLATDASKIASAFQTHE